MANGELTDSRKMLSRFRSTVSNIMAGIRSIPDASESTTDTESLEIKYAYTRPEFLQMSYEEVQVSADHQSRPILVPRDIDRLPWDVGYAESINGGKSKLNEDQSCCGKCYVRSCNSQYDSDDDIQPCSLPPFISPFKTKRKASSELSNQLQIESVPFYYFSIFDGHAGTGASLMAVHLTHIHIQEKLSEVFDCIISKQNCFGEQQKESNTLNRYTVTTRDVGADELVIGALEQAFFEMDDQIARERKTYKISGGCTALVAIFIFGKLYVANAGDCRAVICRGNEVLQLSHDFTPETERARLQNIAVLQPNLLHNEFTATQFTRRIHRRDIGKKMLHRPPHMDGWSYKEVTEEDLKFPLVSGEGKRARMLATIGVTRGFGDHDLTVYDSEIYLKPFLTPIPEVQVYDMFSYDHCEDDVLILASDGLWDVLSNQRVAEIVANNLSQFEKDNHNRYTSAAQELVLNARGIPKGDAWRTTNDKPASGDDISVFVIPLNHYGIAELQSSSTESSFDAS